MHVLDGARGFLRRLLLCRARCTVALFGSTAARNKEQEYVNKQVLLANSELCDLLVGLLKKGGVHGAGQGGDIVSGARRFLKEGGNKSLHGPFGAAAKLIEN